FHLKCWKWIDKLHDGYKTKHTRNLRLFNEIPVFFLFSIIILAILKPL
ncbi:MAG: TIGR00701 family protein, partial [Woeseiaceae bacterium]|nr:TIGR00701 family protein [Woeseiaceae bacterium]